MGCTTARAAPVCWSCTARSSGSRAWTHCHRCGAPVRPDVVWFGELLPVAVTTAAWDVAARCDAVVVVGTSGLVWPAAQLPFVARDAGAAVIEINPEPTEVSPAARIACRGPAGHVLPALVAALTETERGPT